jgi:hypothetical protein
MKGALIDGNIVICDKESDTVSGRMVKIHSTFEGKPQKLLVVVHR